MIVYLKNTDREQRNFDEILKKKTTLSGSYDVSYVVENRRSFRELSRIKNKPAAETVIFITSIYSLGMNDEDVASELQWFIDNHFVLFIGSIESSFRDDVTENKIVLETIIDCLLLGNPGIKKVIKNEKESAGRKKLPYPDKWEECFDLWEKGEISSSEFLKRSGLKRATFYNLITEYKQAKDKSDKYSSVFVKDDCL